MMDQILIRSSAVLALVFALMAVVPSASAHPHIWIDVRSTVVLDAEGRAVAIEQEWVFDRLYSAFATEGMDPETETGRAALRELADVNVQNLKEFDYFNKVTASGDRVTLSDVTEYDSEMLWDRLSMRMLVPLSRPVDLRTEAFVYSIADPSYYIEMSHFEGSEVGFRGPPGVQTVAAGSCSGRIIPPNPTPQAIMMAQLIDQDETLEERVGALFAEKVAVEC